MDLSSQEQYALSFKIWAVYERRVYPGRHGRMMLQVLGAIAEYECAAMLAGEYLDQLLRTWRSALRGRRLPWQPAHLCPGTPEHLVRLGSFLLGLTCAGLGNYGTFEFAYKLEGTLSYLIEVEGTRTSGWLFCIGAPSLSLGVTATEP